MRTNRTWKSIAIALLLGSTTASATAAHADEPSGSTRRDAVSTTDRSDYGIEPALDQRLVVNGNANGQRFDVQIGDPCGVGWAFDHFEASWSGGPGECHASRQGDDSSCALQVQVSVRPSSRGTCHVEVFRRLLTVPVYRWWQPDDRDWISVAHAAHEPSDAAMSSWGYSRAPGMQFLAYLAPGADRVAVNRWWQPDDRDWVTVAEGHPSDQDMMSFGYQHKTFQFYALRDALPGTVPVYRWWQGDDRDWITIASGEISDELMRSWGYSKLDEPMFYVFPR